MARRFDPDRRERILSAALDCVVEHGVARTTHRRIATAADVPLGSLTYHFASLDEILGEAFHRFASAASDRFERRMAAAVDTEAALDAIVDDLHTAAPQQQHERTLLYELYALAARDPAYRAITQRWMVASRSSLQRHFPVAVTRELDAYVEGVGLHLHLDPDLQDRATTRAALVSLASVLGP